MDRRRLGHTALLVGHCHHACHVAESKQERPTRLPPIPAVGRAGRQADRGRPSPVPGRPRRADAPSITTPLTSPIEGRRRGSQADRRGARAGRRGAPAGAAAGVGTGPHAEPVGPVHQAGNRLQAPHQAFPGTARPSSPGRSGPIKRVTSVPGRRPRSMARMFAIYAVASLVIVVAHRIRAGRQLPDRGTPPRGGRGAIRGVAGGRDGRRADPGRPSRSAGLT